MVGRKFRPLILKRPVYPVRVHKHEVPHNDEMLLAFHYRGDFFVQCTITRWSLFYTCHMVVFITQFFLVLCVSWRDFFISKSRVAFFLWYKPPVFTSHEDLYVPQRVVSYLSSSWRFYCHISPPAYSCHKMISLVMFSLYADHSIIHSHRLLTRIAR